MEVIRRDTKVPIMSWCRELEQGALDQAVNVATHPRIFHHVALMPDAHQGFGMPIGGVAALDRAVCPYMVGVDIGCGMCAVRTDITAAALMEREIRDILADLRNRVPLGFDHHAARQSWGGFKDNRSRQVRQAGWCTEKVWDLACRSLGTLGGGNHFIEIQAGDDSLVWLMLHSGSRNLGKVIAEHYHRLAMRLNVTERLPHGELAFLDVEGADGQAYIRDMNFALDFARKNRRRMVEVFCNAVERVLPGTAFLEEINIHHNYAAPEKHFGREVWVHRKGATAAFNGQRGIIPGSMGTASYIVEGLGNRDSFCSCSHGAGRVLGRRDVCRSLGLKGCDAAMRGVVFDGWSKIAHGRLKGGYDFSEAPQVYKDIDAVIEAQLDLVRPVVRLRPLGVLKG